MTDELAPRAPESLPKYLAEGLPKQDVSTLEDAQAYIEELIEHKQRPLEPDELANENEEIVDTEDSDQKGTIVIKKVTCGDSTCHCYDGEKHGPYRYRHYRDESGKSTADYLGKAE